MVWVGDFSHDAAPYERPGAVAALYGGKNPFPSAWSSPNVAKLFDATPFSASSTAISPKDEDIPQASSPTVQPMQALNPKSPNFALAIGAVVVGSLSTAAILFAIIGAFVLQHRKKHRFSRMQDKISKPIPLATMRRPSQGVMKTPEPGLEPGLHFSSNVFEQGANCVERAEGTVFEVD